MNQKGNGMGATLTIEGEGPIKLMYVNANLTQQAQREGIAHEMAHVLAGHGASLDMYMANGHKHLGIKRQTDWQEQEAVVISTMLLIPEAVRDSPFSDREVADMCQVGLRCARYARSFVPMDGLRLVAS